MNLNIAVCEDDDIDLFYFDHIVMQNGKEIVLSRNNRAGLKNQYQQFLFHLARRGTI